MGRLISGIEREIELVMELYDYDSLVGTQSQQGSIYIINMHLILHNGRFEKESFWLKP
jgi:hypothetical protein